MKPLWTVPFVVLTLSTFFLFTGFYFLIPAMPLYIKQLGGSESQVGLVMGLFTIAAVVVRPFIGGLLDQVGRKVFVVWGLILFALLMYPYTWVSGIVLLFVLRIVHGASWAVSTTAISTAVTDHIPAHRRGEGMGWFGLSNTAAMAIGPLLGVWMLGQYSFSSLFTLAAALAVIALLGAALMKMPYQPAKRGRMVLFNKVLLPVAGAIFFMAFIYGGVASFLPLFAESIKVNSGTFFLVYAISLAVARMLSGRLSDRYGEVYTILPGIVLTIAAMVALAFIQSVAGIVLAAVLFGLGFGSAQPALQAMMLRLVGPDQRGMANASFATAFDLGIGIGSIVLGWISQMFGFTALFAAGAISGAIALLVYIFSARKAQPASGSVNV
ncbi:MFS transporter [Paenibacillus thalictri]|uniref:MFS transporter n=1 Tax=Paenibacillus thalictri TaxID=2527873 RepID=A0A4Q9DGE1_9BACL|nr:MFS transporter [Paenibacillus thalictri]TBL70762.1 MFS transporter [Paenibacillus thalictri]